MVPKTPAAVKTVDGLLKALLVLSRTVDHVLETRAVEAAVIQPLSASKVQILRLLGERGGQTSTQVARFLAVTKPAVTQMMDSMMRARLVTRRTAKADRREVNLQLSKKGRDLYQAVHQAQRHHLRNALRQAPRHDADQWIEMLHELASALAQADQAFKHFCAQCGAHKDATCVLVGGDAECLYLQQTPKRSRRGRAPSARL